MKATTNAAVQELVDPHELANIDDLELIARWVVEGFLHGLPVIGWRIS